MHVPNTVIVNSFKKRYRPKNRLHIKNSSLIKKVNIFWKPVVSVCGHQCPKINVSMRRFNRNMGVIEAKLLCLMIKLRRVMINRQSRLAPSSLRWNKWAKRMQYPRLNRGCLRAPSIQHGRLGTRASGCKVKTCRESFPDEGVKKDPFFLRNSLE